MHPSKRSIPPTNKTPTNKPPQPIRHHPYPVRHPPQISAYPAEMHPSKMNHPPHMNVHPHKTNMMNIHPVRNPAKMNVRPARMNVHPKEPSDVLSGYHQVPIVRNSPVVVVNGVKAKQFNCEAVYNLFCQYGDVLKVMFMKERNMMLVQMATHEFALAVVKYIDKVSLFGCTFFAKLSSKAYLYEKYSSTLEDGTPSNVDYTNSEFHRYVTKALAKRNNRQPPSKHVMFYYAPANFQIEQMNEICEKAGVAKPVKTMFFDNKGRPSSAGLFKFADVTAALEAIAKVNHHKVMSAKGKEFIIRLCFSQQTIPDTYEKPETLRKVSHRFSEQ